MTSSQRSFSDEQIVEAKKLVTIAFSQIANTTGFGFITIDFNLEKERIEVKSQINYRFLKIKK